MGKALELVTGIVTAAGGATVDLTMASGNSLTVRNAAPGSTVRLLNVWADVQTAAILRIRSPQLHDNVQGIRLRVSVSEVDPLLPFEQVQRLIPQDTLQVDLNDASGAGVIDTASLLVQYDDLPGVNGVFLTVDEVKSRMVNTVSVENTIAAGITGNYTGQEAINAEFDLLHANTEYAIMGYLVSVECASVRWLSSDFGNLGLGGPGNDLDKKVTANWFMDIAEKADLPLVPVFNSANASSVLIDVAQDENGVDVIVSTLLAQLR